MNTVNVRDLAAELKAKGVHIPTAALKDQVKLAKYFDVKKNATYLPRGLGFKVMISQAKAEAVRKRLLAEVQVPEEPTQQEELWDDAPTAPPAIDGTGKSLHTAVEELSASVAEVKAMLRRVMDELNIA